MGIEPTFSAWEADVLPLNYTRMMGPSLHHTTVSSSPRKGRPADDTVFYWMPEQVRHDKFDGSPEGTHYLV